MNTLYLAVCQLRLEMPWVRSLKEKRALVKPVVEKVRVRFGVSVARLDGLDAHSWELIGICALSADRVALERLMQHVQDFVAAQGSYRIAARALDLEVWEGLREA